jgi:APA family basic amino acid/polyamine antiporter
VAVLVAVGFALVGDLKLIAGVADFAIYLVFVAVNATVILLRVRGVPAPAGSFRVPGTLGGVPVIPVFGSLVVLLMIAHLDLRSIAIGVALLLLGGLAAWLSTRQRAR